MESNSNMSQNQNTSNSNQQGADYGRQNQDQQYGNEYFPDYVRPQPDEVIFEWQSDSRPFRKRQTKFFTTILTIVLLLSFILFFAGQLLPIAVVVAVAFLYYIMNTIPPESVMHRISTYGIKSNGELYYWQELGRFWFETKQDTRILYVEVARFPNRLTLLLGNSSENDLRKILSEILLEERPPLTTVEKAADWLSKKFPIDVDG